MGMPRNLAPAQQKGSTTAVDVGLPTPATYLGIKERNASPVDSSRSPSPRRSGRSNGVMRRAFGRTCAVPVIRINAGSPNLECPYQAAASSPSSNVLGEILDDTSNHGNYTLDDNSYLKPPGPRCHVVPDCMDDLQPGSVFRKRHRSSSVNNLAVDNDHTPQTLLAVDGGSSSKSPRLSRRNLDGTPGSNSALTLSKIFCKSTETLVNDQTRSGNFLPPIKGTKEMNGRDLRSPISGSMDAGCAGHHVCRGPYAKQGHRRNNSHVTTNMDV